MSKKLYISLIFSNLVVLKTLSSNHRMYNLYTKFVKILEICKQFSENLGRTRQTLWSAVQMLTQKLCCQTIHDCPKVVPLHYESE